MSLFYILKKFLFTGLFIIVSLFLYGEDELVKKGDVCFGRRNDFLDLKEAIDNIEIAINSYKRVLEKGFDEIVFYKLTKAIDFKYSFLLRTDESKIEGIKLCKFILDEIDKYPIASKDKNSSVYILYAKATLGKILINLLDKKDNKLLLIDIARKVKDSAERLLLLDEEFEGYIAYLILGRLHYKTPKIIFVLPWPDKHKSKEYLQIYLSHNPDSLVGLYFLADTLYSLGQKENAWRLYLKVVGSKARKSFYYEDKSIIEEAGNKMKDFY